MTTLPQTIEPRVSRPVPRAASPGAAQAAAAAARAMTLADALRVLRSNALLIVASLVIALAIGLAVNQFVLLRYFKSYAAVAVLQVQSPALYDPINAVGQGAPDRPPLEVRQKTIAQKLQNESLWQPLFQNDRGAFVNDPWVQSFRTPEGRLDTAAVTAAIARNLRVSPDASSELINASFSAPAPEDARVVLDAIVGQLLATEQQLATAASADERRTLSEISGRLTAQVSNLTTQINELAGRLAAPRERGGGGGGLLMARQMEMNLLLSDRAGRQKLLDQAQGELTRFNAELEAGGVPLLLLQALAADPSLQSLEQQQNALEVEKRRLAALNAGAESRSVQAVDAALAATKAQLDERRDALRVSRGDVLRASLSATAAGYRAELDAINARARELETAIAEATAEQTRLDALIRQRELADEKRGRIDDRLQTLEANQSRENSRRGTVSLVYDIKTPERISFPRLAQTLAAAGLLGLGLSVGAAFLREMTDTRVRSPRDLAGVGGLTLLGTVSHRDDDPRAADGDLPLAISQMPESVVSEGFRQVRSRLQHAASLDATRSMLVTSPGPGDGKTTVACNLAAGLAQGGRKVLLVDANVRRPALHAVFAIENGRGLWDALADPRLLDSAAARTTVANLDVLPAGARPANPSELLESSLLGDLIERALEDYDHVIFDAGPILLTSETAALAARVDGVISVVRADANSRGLLARMRDALRQVRAEHLGVVLNAVRDRAGGYYARNTRSYYAYSDARGD